ncbi:MAG TPA: hypothetical protein VNZ66_00470, partial [Aeromicrobium sp.]|nr:hypothetical protein [Aeromicrobium sp.]
FAAEPTFELLEPTNTRSFQVVLRGLPATPPVRHGDHPLTLEEHLWVPVALVRELAAGRVDDSWDDDLEAMIGYAESRGWFDSDKGTIRGHCVRRPGGDAHSGQ